MGLLGPSDQKDLVLPSLWDTSYINNFRLENGRAFEALLGEIRSALSAFNANDLFGMDHYGDLIAVQDSPEVEYATGTTAGVEEFVEYKVADPQRGATTGHMIDLKTYNRSLGWTMLYLMKARDSKLDADLKSVFTDIRSHWQRVLLQRFFKSTATTIGSTGKNVPFADGGTADSTYVPYESPRGATFLSTHTHFLRHTATLTEALINASILHLWEHGHDAPYDIIIPQADIAAWQAVTSATGGFRAPTWTDLRYMSTTTVHADTTGIMGDIFGYWESPYGIARIWATPRLPTNYYGVFKTYGRGDGRNPLRVRFDPKVGIGWNIVPGQLINAPQYMAAMMSQFGVGVGEDRTNGVAVFLASSGSYADPVVT